MLDADVDFCVLRLAMFGTYRLFFNSNVIFSDLQRACRATILIAQLELEEVSQRPAICWLEFYLLHHGILDTYQDFCVLRLVMFGNLRLFLNSF
jgi:hypothetical protein